MAALGTFTAVIVAVMLKLAVLPLLGVPGTILTALTIATVLTVADAMWPQGQPASAGRSPAKLPPPKRHANAASP
jgi:hypothetical protein